MENKKVLFISAANSIHTVKWVNALSKKFEVHLVYCNNHKPNIDKINERVVLHELKYKAPLGYYLNFLQLRKIYKNIKPNIVNVHYASGYGTLSRIAKIKVNLLSVWGSDVYDFPNSSKIKRKILEKNIMYAENIASTSVIMAEKLKKQVEKLKKDVYITPFGVDIKKFKKTNSKEKNTFNIANIKSLKEVYGIEYGILAVKILKEQLIKEGEENLAKSIKFDIYGEGPKREELEETIIKENLQDTIFLRGAIPNEKVPEILSNLDVFCVTSNTESFGVSLIEAMACEVPIVATNADGFCEVMEDGVTGYIVQTKNSEQIALALKKIIKNRSKAKIMGINGRKRVLEKYNWNKNVETMIQIYKEVEETF